jgi:hypothetical protein
MMKRKNENKRRKEEKLKKLPLKIIQIIKNITSSNGKLVTALWGYVEKTESGKKLQKFPNF